MEGKTRIIFRADGNSQIGLGHVVRSLALAEMLRHDFECVFAIQAPAPELQQQIRQTCEGVIILPTCHHSEERFIHELDAYIAEDVLVVLDGYGFNTAYQQSIKRKGCPLFCIDDIHRYTFVADAVLNQAGGVESATYKTAPYTKLLLGPKYALLRPPFLQAATQERTFPTGEVRVFLNLGGADPQNHTLRIARELQRIQRINKVELIVGSAYQHLPDLQNWLQQNPTCRLHQNLSAEEMCRLMHDCGIAITSASGVAYEYASVGGLLFILQTADNQEGLYTFLTQNGLAQKYEQLPQSINDELPSAFEQIVANQRQHFDGKSGERLREVFRNMALAASLSMREATADDLLLLYDWANDPVVRKQSFNPNPILLESHTRWLYTKLEDKQAKLYIAEAAGVPVAHIRFELRDGKAIISYLIGSDFRGKGLGHVILQKGVAILLQQNPALELVEGLVQKENKASVRAFEKAGFSYGTPDPKFPQAHRFELRPQSIK
ncbi:UDP-2,4-diacetamido-2,4,6-trideoxy-beta-L-altropyranose hydrolase [Pontibacter flavimaris]|uniref:UDP-2,4-diacetamido-2,4, 6-trideoxy-beta-L-altropyranose hydrolase n=1 Tax=Pontibacter flavimaris TaxID=1797110 RepID=A0A1Q5PGF1_9BACT|nr:UDP-2,4-diacetamido-2,4,6-trideoxy-beta-L-altropyranose hydrolase [Pontibacter flavimaris]OKL41320.1 UDP-2,4-diacetamido-2,4,6-trideoxy-beta-L-altropyranose hydrolase [Pontibacter flavimaris]